MPKKTPNEDSRFAVVPGDEKGISRRFPKSLAESRGVLHARHVKMIVANMSPDTKGAVVYLDSEGSWTKTISPALLVYYRAFFLELTRPAKVGKEEPEAVRGGMYAIRHEMVQIARIEGLEDLFLWHLDYDHAGTIKWTKDIDTVQNKRPFKQTPGRLTMDVQDFPVTSVDGVTRKAVPLPLNALSVARQGLLNEDYDIEDRFPKQKPACGWTKDQLRRSHLSLPDPGMNRVLTSVFDFDISVSLVRDPRYPQADPRIQRNQSTTLRGDYRKVVPKADPEELPDKALTMVIRDALDAKAPPIEETQVEPEAPMLLPTPDTFITITKTGTVAVCTRSGGKWSRLAALPATKTTVALRRLRAITSVSAGSHGLFIFYITTDRHIQARRRLPNATWTDPVTVGDATETHPFSNLSCDFTAPGRVWVFFMDVAGLLHTISFEPTATQWSNETHKALERTPDPKVLTIVLAGTAVASISPSPNNELVFVVGRDLRLRMNVYVAQARAWWPFGLVVVTEARTREVRLFAHTRLAVHSPDPKTVLVAAINHAGHIIIYVVRDVSGIWMLQQDPVVYAKVPPKRPLAPMDKPTRIEWDDVNIWNVNPFGDLALAIKDGQTVCLCAGTAPGRSALLMLSTSMIGAPGVWEIVP
jgi:hypothetical protein